MRKHIFTFTMIFLFLSASTILTTPTFAKDKPVLLKCPIAFPSALPGLGTTIKWFADRISTASNGSVKMKIYEPDNGCWVAWAFCSP